MATVDPLAVVPMVTEPARKNHSTKRAQPLSPKEKAAKRRMRRYAQRHNRAV